MKSLVVLPVHGMGSPERDYADGLRDELRRRFGEAAWRRVAFEPLYYQGVIMENQRAAWERMARVRKLAWRKLRRFMMDSFSDAACLEHHSEEPDSPYVLAQAEIRDSMAGLLDAGVDPGTPVALLPYSLGCQVISNYIWDSQRNQGVWRHRPLSRPGIEIDFLKLATLHVIVSTGCNIPLFVAGLDPIEPISRPPTPFRWINIYDKDDVLGWPLKPLGPGYDALVERDIAISSGTPLSAWTPASHTAYWSDRDCLDRMVDALRPLLGSP